MALRMGFGFRLSSGVGVFFGGSGAIWIALAIGSMRLVLAMIFLAAFGALALMKLAAQCHEASPRGRRKLVDPYFREAVNWDVAEGLTTAPLWGVYAIDDSFFTGRHPKRRAQLRAVYPDRADRVVSVGIFPSSELARACARGLRKHGFSTAELIAIYGQQAAPRATQALPSASGAT